MQYHIFVLYCIYFISTYTYPILDNAILVVPSPKGLISHLIIIILMDYWITCKQKIYKK